MNKLLACMLIFGIAILQTANSLAASSWDDFNSLMGNFYLFDNQKVDRVTCRITAPSLDPVTLRQTLKPIENNVRLEENLSTFKVIYSRGDGISFNVPYARISIVAPEKAPDLQKVEAAVKNFNQNAEGAIQGAVQSVEGILDEFIMPKQTTLTDLVVAKSISETTVTYKRRGEPYTDLYSGNTRKTHSSMAGNEFDAMDEFDKINGKYFLSKVTSRMTQGDIIVDTDMVIKRKDLGKIHFPSAIESKVKMSGMGMKMDAEVAIELTECIAE